MTWAELDPRIYVQWEKRWHFDAHQAEQKQLEVVDTMKSQMILNGTKVAKRQKTYCSADVSKFIAKKPKMNELETIKTSINVKVSPFIFHLKKFLSIAAKKECHSSNHGSVIFLRNQKQNFERTLCAHYSSSTDAKERKRGYRIETRARRSVNHSYQYFRWLLFCKIKIAKTKIRLFRVVFAGTVKTQFCKLKLHRSFS